MRFLSVKSFYTKITLLRVALRQHFIETAWIADADNELLGDRVEKKIKIVASSPWAGKFMGGPWARSPG